MKEIQQNKINDRIFNLNSTDVELNIDNARKPISADNSSTRDVPICITDRAIDGKSKVSDKRQKLRRMVGAIM